MIKIIQNSPHVRVHDTQLVLVKAKIQLCTFLSFVFINQENYQQNGIENELLVHERTHARQLHSLDILLVEILLVIFWFNPILYFFKRAIKLNHEFLADEAVVKQYQNVRFYQELLLQKTMGYPNFQLTNGLIFQLTKQRLMMMTKTTSVAVAIFKKMILAPVFTILAIALCSISMAQKPTPSTTQQPRNQTDGQMILTKNDVNLENAEIYVHYDFKKGEKPRLTKPKKYNELTEEEKSKLGEPFYWEKISPTQETLDFWIKSGERIGFWVNWKKIPDGKIKDYKVSDIAQYGVTKLFKNAWIGKRRYQIDMMTHKYYDEVYIPSVKKKPLFFVDMRTKKKE